MEYLWVAIGGGLGSALRYFTVTSTARILGTNYTHYGTLAVNCIGSFLAVFFMILYVEKLSLDPAVRLFFVVGFLGGFTTFSAYSYETIAMLHSKLYFSAAMNILSSNLLSLFFGFMGLFAAKALIR